jgi:hypothetical protein
MRKKALRQEKAAGRERSSRGTTVMQCGMRSVSAVLLALLLGSVLANASAKPASQSKTVSTAEPGGPLQKKDLPADKQDATAPSSADLTSPTSSMVGGSNDALMPRIVVNAVPPAVKAEWSIHEKILWAATLILTVLGYCGVILGFRTLRQIKRQAEMSEAASTAALECAAAIRAAHERQLRAERPWLLVSVEHSSQSPEEFDILLSNRGRSAAEIISLQECIGLTPQWKQIPSEPQFTTEMPRDNGVRMILLPGEVRVLLSFNRNDIRWICKSEDLQQQVKKLLLHILLYGKVEYRALDNGADRQEHRTAWCCRYVHGETKSELKVVHLEKHSQHT